METQTPCECEKYRAARMAAFCNKQARNGEIINRDSRSSGNNDLCECDHYAVDHELNGRCTAMIWDKSKWEPWEVNTHGQPVKARGKVTNDG